jgi:hypothetical protein
MKKEKRHGHYCRICGLHKSNEKFSGRGHAAHICKECHALSVSERNERRRISEIARIAEGFFISKENLNRLTVLAKDKRYPEAGEYTRDTLNDYRARMDEYHGNASESDGETAERSAPMKYSDLDAALGAEIESELEELITGFITEAGYIPEEDDIEELAQMFCEEFFEEEDVELIQDEEIMSMIRRIIKRRRMEGEV